MIKSEELSNPKSCINQSRPDEMVFVLTARDKLGPIGVRAWADAYEAAGGRPEKVAEARACAAKMEEQQELMSKRHRIAKAAAALSPEAVAMANSGGAYARQMDSEEREAQRRSFAFGNASLSNPNVTRELVDEVAEQMKRGG